MLFAWLRIGRNAALPNAALAGAAHCTVSNTFSTSIRAEAIVVPPVMTRLLIDRSTLFRQGDNTPGSARGEFPNWLAGAAANAPLLKYRLSSTFALIRLVMSPSTRRPAPGTMFGRCVPPNRNGVVVWFWVTPIGNPLGS